LIGICSKKLALDPIHKKALYIRASSYMKKGLFDAAIADTNSLISIDESNVGAYYIRGKLMIFVKNSKIFLFS